MPAVIPLGVTAYLYTALSRLCTILRPPRDSHLTTGGTSNVTQPLSHPFLLSKATLGIALFCPVTGKMPWRTVSDIQEHLPSSPPSKGQMGAQGGLLCPKRLKVTGSEPSPRQAGSRASFLNHCAWASVDGDGVHMAAPVWNVTSVTQSHSSNSHSPTVYKLHSDRYLCYVCVTPGSGRSPGGGNGNPLQYPCLGKPMDRGAWQATVNGVAKSDTTEQLTHTLMCTHTLRC